MTDASPEPPPLTRVGRALARAAAGPVTLPVPEMPLQPLVTVAVVALAGLLTITAFAGPPMVALAVAFAAGVIAWGWAGQPEEPSPAPAARRLCCLWGLWRRSGPSWRPATIPFWPGCQRPWPAP